MSKESRQPPRRPADRSKARDAYLEVFADPFNIVDNIERDSGDADAPWWARIEELMPRAIDRSGGVDRAGDAKHLRQTSAGFTLEQAARHTGFVLGFEYCCALLAKRGGAK